MNTRSGVWAALGATAALAAAGAAHHSRRAGSRADSEALAKRPWAYHLSWASALGSIARHGLLPKDRDEGEWPNPPGVYLVARFGDEGGSTIHDDPNDGDTSAWLRFPWPDRVVNLEGKSISHAETVVFGEARTGPVAPDRVEVLVNARGHLAFYDAPEEGFGSENRWVSLVSWVASKPSTGEVNARGNQVQFQWRVSDKPVEFPSGYESRRAWRKRWRK